MGQPADSDTYSYDPNTGRMTSYTFTVGATPKSIVGNLTWNANGSLSKLAITDGFNSGGTQTCKYGDPTASVPGYDDLGRLVKIDCGASTWQQNFSYDPFGNLTKTVPTGGTGIAWNPGYNQANNRYTLGGTSYDANGNLLTDTFHAYTWNMYGHLSTIDSTACGTNGTCLTYDAFDRMVEKNVAGVYSEVLYSPIGKTALMNGNTIVDVYVPLPGGSTFHMVPGGQTFRHPDWLGTARLESSRQNRAVSYDRAYAPFGEPYKNFGTTTGYDFTGDTQDTIAGTFDTPYRELNPTQGRWLSPDPAGLMAVNFALPQSWNRYSYVQNLPLTAVDPSGLACYPQELKWFGSCAPFMNNGVNFWDSFNEFDLMNIPVVSQNLFNISGQPTWVPNPDYNPNDSGSIMGTFVTSADWLQVGTGFDLQTSSWWSAANNNDDNLPPISKLIKDLIMRPWAGGILLPLGIPVGPALGVAIDPVKGFACVSPGFGVGGRGANAGPLWGDVNNSYAILSGWSVNGNLAGPIGAQIIQNSDGTLYGPTFGSPGISLSITYGFCKQF